MRNNNFNILFHLIKLILHIAFLLGKRLVYKSLRKKHDIIFNVGIYNETFPKQKPENRFHGG